MRASHCLVSGVVALVHLSLAATTHAQMPSVAYQGALTDQGQPAQGSYDFRFRLFDSVEGGIQQGGALTNFNRAVSGGLFTADLQFDPDDLDGGLRFLEVGVRPAGSVATFETLSPRQPLSATPYAIKAGRVELGSITSDMLAEGAVTFSKISGGAVSSLGTPDGSIPSVLMVDNQGHVGLGTGTPLAGLHLANGTAVFRTDLLAQLLDESGASTNLNGAFEFAGLGNLLAVAGASDDAVTLYDMSLPDAPVVLSQLKDGENGVNDLNGAMGLAMDRSLLAIAASVDDAVSLVDISNPANPFLRSVIRDDTGGFNDLNGAFHPVIFDKWLAVAAYNDDAVSLIDISNPNSPQLARTLKDGVLGVNHLNGAVHLTVSGSLMAVAADIDNAVTLFDVTNPVNPVILSTIRDGVSGFNDLDGTYGVFIQDGLLGIAARADDAVTLVDISDPSNPMLLSVLKQNVNGLQNFDGPRRLAMNGNLMAVSAFNSDAVTFLDISNPSAPLYKGVMNAAASGLANFEGPAGLLWMNGRLAVATASSDGFAIIQPGESLTSLVTVGAVGIGTDAPEASLHVVGDVLIENAHSVQLRAGRVSLGQGAEASGEGSLAMGPSAIAAHDGSMVFADSNPLPVASSADNQLTIRAAGGVRMFSNAGASAGVQLNPGATAWSVLSDRTLKKNIQSVDHAAVLDHLEEVDVSMWLYDWEPEGTTPHLGPMAQDFKAAFYPGRDDRSITTLEMDGVALSAIKGLNRKLEDAIAERDREIKELKSRNEELLKRLEAIERKIR